jgi:hypothetical protein
MEYTHAFSYNTSCCQRQWGIYPKQESGQSILSACFVGWQVKKVRAFINRVLFWPKILPFI